MRGGGGTAPPAPNQPEKQRFSAKRLAVRFGRRSVSNGKSSGRPPPRCATLVAGKGAPSPSTPQCALIKKRPSFVRRAFFLASTCGKRRVAMDRTLCLFQRQSARRRHSVARPKPLGMTAFFPRNDRPYGFGARSVSDGKRSRTVRPPHRAHLTAFVIRSPLTRAGGTCKKISLPLDPRLTP